MTFSQTRTVSGIVTDINIGEPLIGVNVMYGTGMGTVTDINGEFILKLEPGNYTLSVSYLGFVSQQKRFLVTKKD